jgi:hypothetical protein
MTQAAALRVAFPEYVVSVRVGRRDKPRFEVVSREGGDPYCLISSDFQEIWRELRGVGGAELSGGLVQGVERSLVEIRGRLGTQMVAPRFFDYGRSAEIDEVGLCREASASFKHEQERLEGIFELRRQGDSRVTRSGPAQCGPRYRAVRRTAYAALDRGFQLLGQTVRGFYLGGYEADDVEERPLVGCG